MKNGIHQIINKHWGAASKQLQNFKTTKNKKMTLAQYITKHGTRAAAIKLVDNRVIKMMGLSVHDLPDVPALSEIYDALEDVLINDDLEHGKHQLKTILKQIDHEFIESVCW